MEPDDKILLVLSGGQDSTTCAWWAKREYPDAQLHAVTFDYSQRHIAELEAARHIGGLLGVRSHEFITLGPILKGTSPLVSGETLEQYADMNSLPGGLEKTFVPMRNMLFLTIAANRAVCLGADIMITGVCQEDNGGYPDCRQVFLDAIENATDKALHDRDQTPEAPYLDIVAPLMDLSKAESVALAISLGYDAWSSLAWSHTAYDGQFPPTGHDHATLLREKGFHEHGSPDPLWIRALYNGVEPYAAERITTRDEYRGVLSRFGEGLSFKDNLRYSFPGHG